MRGAYVACAILLVLLACAKPECVSKSDCTSQPASSFISACTDGKCEYAPVPNVCGNAKCDLGEDKNNCASDCGSCGGKVAGAKSLEYQLINNKCVEAVPVALSRPVSLVSDVANAGDKFHVETSYLQPFNLKKDTFAFSIRLEQGAQVRDERIVDVELSGMTKDRRKLILGRKDLNRQLWEGVPFEEELILDFPVFEVEGELNTLVLKVRYEYASLQGDKSARKEGAFQVNYREKFLFVNPPSEYPCPASCDDRNQGTRDSCSANHFCVHDSIPNVCGNGACDSNENKCTCARDCGSCSGGGSFTESSCKGGQCVASVRSSVIVAPSNVFETRDLGPAELAMNYRFSSPFDVTKDSFFIDVKQYRIDAGVSKVTIQNIRLLEGSQVVAESLVNKEVGPAPMTIAITVPALTVPEEEKVITAAVWYSYVKDEKTVEGMFQKPLGKVALVSPG